MLGYEPRRGFVLQCEHSFTKAEFMQRYSSVIQLEGFHVEALVELEILINSGQFPAVLLVTKAQIFLLPDVGHLHPCLWHEKQLMFWMF